MKKRLSTITAIAVGFLLMTALVAVVSSQEDQAVDQQIADPPVIQEFDQQAADRLAGVTNASFQEVSVDLFEDPTLWTAHISGDDGYSTHQRFEGGPAAKVSLNITQLGGDTDQNVLGVKTEFLRRGFTEIVFQPLRPIPIPGQVREIDLWVAGRELPHELCVRVRDVNLQTREVCSINKLNFRGWQQINMQIPPYVRLSDGLYIGVQQYNPRRPLDTGLELLAIVIKPLFTEAYGTYYVYFDDMRATTDLSIITSRDLDDIVDAW